MSFVAPSRWDILKFHPSKINGRVLRDYLALVVSTQVFSKPDRIVVARIFEDTRAINNHRYRVTIPLGNDKLYVCLDTLQTMSYRGKNGEVIDGLYERLANLSVIDRENKSNICQTCCNKLSKIFAI